MSIELLNIGEFITRHFGLVLLIEFSAVMCCGLYFFREELVQIFKKKCAPQLSSAPEAAMADIDAFFETDDFQPKSYLGLRLSSLYSEYLGGE